MVDELIMHFQMLSLVNATVSDVEARRINRRNRRGGRTWGVAKGAEVGDSLLPRLRPWIHVARLEWLSEKPKTWPRTCTKCVDRGKEFFVLLCACFISETTHGFPLEFVFVNVCRAM
jgi:hypothetical protein